ncbi:hypothetical protein FDECE_9910 [Fusarium decemcellulare]|nr:hypothetical protein FDECE_9910 [Fusarium decemcellulare]
MKLVKIDYDDVLADCKDGRSTKYNTCFHPVEQIPVDQRHNHLSRPSESPYSFERWLPLILRTRHLNPEKAQIVKLRPAQAKLLVEASGSSIITGEPSRAYQEDIREEVLPAFSSLKFPPEGLFVRLDRCSPKDGRQTVPGRLSLHSTDDIILRLTTSQRARNDMLKSLEAGASTIDATFLPFNDRMESKREYRVYCAPETGVITAVSQYCWHKPWIMAGRQPESSTTKVAARIWHEIQGIHREILQDLNPESELDKLLLSQGFSFDIFYDEEKESSQLVELNVFGARSGCGSCLFNWIEDFDVLYGDGVEVEFRVTW